MIPLRRSRQTTSALATGGVAAAGLLLLAGRERRRARAAERLGAALLETLLNAIDATDAQTGAHVRRVAAYSLVLASAAGVRSVRCREIERVALFHDIGKIHEALFDIVHDDGSLSPDERRAIATHPERGAKVLEPLSPFYPELAPGVLAHHERWDGSGYPRGLRGTAIPVSARIVAIADTFDAITYSRRYSRGKRQGDALHVLRRGRGKQFDPALVDVFLSPAVQRRIGQVRVGGISAAPPAGERRQHHEMQAPDVSFRWREPLADSVGATDPPAPSEAPDATGVRERSPRA